MGVKGKETLWVRLKRAIRRIRVHPMAGDGGFITDKTLIVTKPQNDTTLIIKDTTVVARPIKQ